MPDPRTRIGLPLAIIGLSLAIPVMATFVSGCKPTESRTLKREGAEPIAVVCTTGMVADMVRTVGGKHVKVTQLMRAGVDPHLYKTSTNDVSALKRAEMIFYSGLHLEANFVSVFDSLSKEKPVYALAEELNRWHHDRLLKTRGKTHDPHIWFDVSLWKLTAKLVADRLGDFDPKNAGVYAENARRYMKKLDVLHEWCKNELSKIPSERRVLVTAHDAFSYFGKAYGVEVRAIQGVSTASEASLKHVEELIAYMVDNRIKSVFVETSVKKDSVRQVIDGCKQKGHTVALGGELFSDAMGQDGTPEGTYVGMLRHNVNTIVKALK